MPNISPLFQLIDVLKCVKDRAAKFHAILVQSEAQTRTTLIDPVLKAMGWDFSDPTMIKVELIHEGTRLDYGLLNQNGEICYIVEAKKLNTNLDQVRNYNTAIDYAFIHGIPHVAVTDGVKWHFYDDFIPGRTIPHVVDLNEDLLSKTVKELISRLDIVNFGYADPIDEVVAQETVAAVVVQRPPVVVTATQQNNGVFTPIDQLEPNLKGHPKPRAIRLPDGSTISIQHWSDVLFELTKFVLAKIPNLQLPLHDNAGGHVNLISYSRPLSRYEAHQYGGREVYIHLNYSSTNCIKNARYIFEKLPMAQRGNIPALRFE